MPDKPGPGEPQGVLEIPPLHGWNKPGTDPDSRANQQQATKSLHAEAYRETVAFVKTADGKSRDGSELTTAGTGFFVTRDGILATDYHVIKNAKSGITVTTSDGVTRSAKIKSVDIKTDLALLQVEPAPGETFKAAKLAKSSTDLGSAESVFTRGHTKRSSESIVSSGDKNSSVKLNTFFLTDGLIAGEDPNRRVITTNMLIDTGNSGGPLVRESDGAVVAIVDFTAPSEKLAISTPVEDLHNLLASSGVIPPSRPETTLKPLTHQGSFQSRPLITMFDVPRALPRYQDSKTPASDSKSANPKSLIDRYSNLQTLPRTQLKPLN